MPQKKHKPEEIVAKLRQVDVLLSQGRSVAEAIRSIGVTPFTYYRWRKEFGGLKTRPGEAAEGAGEGERAAAQGGLGPDAREADPARGRLGKLLSPARRRALHRSCHDRSSTCPSGWRAACWGSIARRSARCRRGAPMRRR